VTHTISESTLIEMPGYKYAQRPPRGRLRSNGLAFTIPVPMHLSLVDELGKTTAGFNFNADSATPNPAFQAGTRCKLFKTREG